jgi:hypothetical protein
MRIHYEGKEGDTVQENDACSEINRENKIHSSYVRSGGAHSYHYAL